MTNQVDVRTALRQAIEEEMSLDNKVFIMGEEVAQYEGAYKITGDLYKKYNTTEKSRVIDTPISEYGFTGIGVGAAMGGLRPIVEFMTFNFAMQAIDHIINSAAKTCYMSGGKISVPIVFRGPNGVASRVAAQHSQCYTSWYAHVPGLKVVTPYFASDAKGLLKAAIRDNNPVVFLENELTYNHVHEVPDSFYDKNHTEEIGKAKILQQGEDITVVSFSIGITKVMEANQLAKNQGIKLEIIDLRTVRPLDIETILTSVRKTNRLLLVEFGWGVGSISSTIAQQVLYHAFDYLDAPIGCINAEDIPLPYAQNLETLALPSTQQILDEILKICYRK